MNQIDVVDTTVETNLDNKQAESKAQVKKVILEKLIAIVQSSTR
jgi:hypothetical protein